VNSVNVLNGMSLVRSIKSQSNETTGRSLEDIFTQRRVVRLAARVNQVSPADLCAFSFRRSFLRALAEFFGGCTEPSFSASKTCRGCAGLEAGYGGSPVRPGMPKIVEQNS